MFCTSAGVRAVGRFCFSAFSQLPSMSLPAAASTGKPATPGSEVHAHPARCPCSASERIPLAPIRRSFGQPRARRGRGRSSRRACQTCSVPCRACSRRIPAQLSFGRPPRFTSRHDCSESALRSSPQTGQRYFSATIRRPEGLRRPHDALKSPLCSPPVQQIRGRIQNTRRHACENTKAKRAANFIERAARRHNPLIR